MNVAVVPAAAVATDGYQEVLGARRDQHRGRCWMASVPPRIGRRCPIGVSTMCSDGHPSLVDAIVSTLPRGLLATLPHSPCELPAHKTPRNAPTRCGHACAHDPRCTRLGVVRAQVGRVVD